MILFSIIFFFFYLNKGIDSSSSAKIIQFKFEKYNINIADINSLKYRPPNYQDNSLNKNDFMFRLFTDDVYINLTIGSPPQIVKTIWNMNKYSFKIYSSSFNFNKSMTYKEISKPFLYSFDETSNALFFEDNFYFIDGNNKTFSNLFKFIKLENDKNNFSFIGLQLPGVLTDNLLTFVKDLKENEIIDKYIFYILYNQSESKIENPNGVIFFGEYPHNTKIFENKYKINNFYEIKAASRNKLAYWDILFDEIYFSENISNNELNKIKYKQVELLGNKQLSIGTDEYQEYIQKNFFDEYIKLNICEQKIILNNTDYIYYKCKKNNEFNIAKFPTLYFELKEINFNFSLDYNDLFFIHDEYIYFGIIFDSFFKLKFDQRWKLGSALFKKYLFVFNQDSKTIGFYNNIINQKIFEPINNRINPDKKNLNNILKIIVIFALIIFIMIIFWIIINYFRKRKGKKNSKLINYNSKSKVAHNFKNKNEIHNYYELKSDLI